MKNTKSTFQDYILYIAWIVSLVATLGSLYFSEIKGFIPCEFCWYQRILMYPLVVIIGIAVFEQNKNIKKYVLPFSIIGMGVSFYHYLIQKVPGLASVKPCVGGVPCNGQYINWLGFITIPFLALIAFTFITVFMLLLRRTKN
ncbi:disulfide oxidoreductase [Lederbergia galactosidilytica]|uniref:Probable disulfide formation protein n=1 Tax=Lederbergia galactosidilytica TaxID=217031 RepID=A0A177ZK36_9BACI|nr:disulfide oxidoreductase [Lederbergia galactosidilytica]MBP1913297.1 disulfide bond formation protein DsbB [Lederbergia galactosidilytica]OAK67943.1 2-oxoglutarate dehydrogenase [Lederbergia galactosidilytica]